MLYTAWQDAEPQTSGERCRSARDRVGNLNCRGTELRASFILYRYRYCRIQAALRKHGRSYRYRFRNPAFFTSY